MTKPRRTGISRAVRYGPLAARSDEALLQRPLTVQQVQILRGWAATVTSVDGLDEVVERHRVPLNIAAWDSHLRGIPTLFEAVVQTGHIARRDVIDVARACDRAGVWTPLLVASYAWGQGRNGYGPRRLADILAAGGGDLETALGAAVAAMRSGAAVDAYQRLQGAISGLGPAFFTKFLYFAGTQVPPLTGPVPLILDAVVAAQVRLVTTDRATESGIPEAADVAAWLWSSGGWSPHRYGVWLDFAAVATRQLTADTAATPSWPPRADVLELATFRGFLHR